MASPLKPPFHIILLLQATKDWRYLVVRLIAAQEDYAVRANRYRRFSASRQFTFVFHSYYARHWQLSNFAAMFRRRRLYAMVWYEEMRHEFTPATRLYTRVMMF